MVANLRVRKLMTAGATIIEPNGRCQAPVALTFPDCSKGIGELDWQFETMRLCLSEQLSVAPRVR